EEGEPSTPFTRRIELDDRIARYLLGLDDLGPQLSQVATIGIWDPDVLRVPPAADVIERLSSLISDVRKKSRNAPSHLFIQIHGRSGAGRRSLVDAICEKHGLRLLRVNVAKLATLPTATFEEILNLLVRESILNPVAICLE